ncbi:MAG: hypothetical protein ACI9MR_003167 [Myxococcota bacterium]|jgi:hypothetical protein
MAHTPRITAERAIVDRTEVLLFTRDAGRRRCDVLSVVIEREGRGISGAYLSRDLAPEDRAELFASAGAGEGEAVPIPLTTARRTLARATLMSRIAGRDVPQWLFTQTDLVSDLHREQGWVEDVYLCTTCATPLSPEQQVAIARQRGDAPLVTWCSSCAGKAEHTPLLGSSSMTVWRARAWVMLAAHEPRRALVYVARAEAAHEHSPDLDAIKGAAALMLANPVQAIHHLRRCVERAPRHIRAHGLLIDALTRCGMAAAAHDALTSLVAAAPHLSHHAMRIRQLLASVEPSTDQGIERRCFHALSLLDCGHVDEAKALLTPDANDGVLPGPGLRAWDALSHGQPPREISRLATRPVEQGVAHAVESLNRAI